MAVLILSNIVYAYSDSALTDIILPNTVRAGQDLNANFIISGIGNVNVDVNIYAPSGVMAFTGSITSLSQGENIRVLDVNLNQSSQPYLIRAKITTTDDNPSNDLYSKYFTVIRSTDKVPVSDVPIFSGILIALVALFFISTKNNKKSKKW